MTWYEVKMTTEIEVDPTYSVMLIEGDEERVDKKTKDTMEGMIYNEYSMKEIDIDSKKEAKRYISRDDDADIAHAADGTTITITTDL